MLRTSIAQSVRHHTDLPSGRAQYSIQGVKRAAEAYRFDGRFRPTSKRSGEIMMTEISNIPDATDSLQDTLGRDFKRIVSKADHLLKDASHSVAEELSATGHLMSERACGAANATHDYVRGNPWKVVGMAAAAGVFIGTLISRR